MLIARYDIVDAVLDTIHTIGRNPYKEESIQEAIEIYLGNISWTRLKLANPVSKTVPLTSGTTLSLCSRDLSDFI